jgi:hypothetical protein
MFAGMHNGAYQLKKMQVFSCDFHESLIWCMKILCFKQGSVLDAGFILVSRSTNGRAKKQM